MEIVSRSLTDNLLWNLGLPVKCKSCGEKGIVKPKDYGGWWRRKLSTGGSWWYCPEDAERVKTHLEAHRTPQFTQESTVEDDLDALMNII